MRKDTTCHDRVEAQLKTLNERILATEINTDVIKQNSNERLETINKRFDDLSDTINKNNERDRWLVNLVGAAVVVFGSVVFYLWMDPLAQRMGDLEDRIDEVITIMHTDPLSPTE